MGVGGTFDFIAGVAVRAPQWMRQHGLEWFHRLMREPRRIRRMLVLPRFAFEVVWLHLKEWFQKLMIKARKR
jgi:N-acetylglucosaminyldiphosphoundecaprenol N-acetyl-beta-D-mannosaminyltransferase